MKEFWVLSICCAAFVGGVVELRFAIEPHPLAEEWGAPWYVMVLYYICAGMILARLFQWCAKKQSQWAAKKEGQ
ncbi:MAG TPA: hypothetical protein VJL82_10610 [Rhizomicrobium sp.]|nr:hypothetical protein [Rhizomicrobium sp.]